MKSIRMRSTGQFFRRYGRSRPAVFAVLFLFFLSFLIVLGPVVYPVDPLAPSYDPLLPPMQGRPLGTDQLGRDIAAQLVSGARVSLTIGITAASITVTIGIIVGAVSGYKGGRVDSISMRFTDIFLMIPTFVLLIVVLTVFPPSVMWKIALVMGVLIWPRTARLTRAEFLSLKERDFVDAARAIGVPERAIIFNEILPNASAPIVVNFSYEVSTAILIEAALSFLGLGDPNNMSWGYTLFYSIPVMESAWWLAFFPGVMIFLTVLSLNLMGDGINEALSPYLR